MLRPPDQKWRESNIMKIPNTNLLEQLGGTQHMGGRLWRLPPFSANTWHRHVDQWELYFVLEGTGRMRVGGETLTVPRHGSVLVAPHMLRQVFNDTAGEVLWLILGAPPDGSAGRSVKASDFYPEDPKALPAELAGHVWPPKAAT
ncbi:MAG TPA: cupin domain-containing protein [Candidatus Polarisedimenticolia bacterium]|nr:cupin domain-containing protein [Candidatus Polarisedimenticolia bacterium]